MKLFYVFVLIFFSSSVGYSQVVHVRHLNSKVIGHDSVNVFFTQYYEIIEDTCAQIIRYGHFDSQKWHFVGKFKDVSKADTLLTVAEGNYAKTGKKDGQFIVHSLIGKLLTTGNFRNDEYDGPWAFYYPNGNLQSKGNFANGEYKGLWQFYYENGSPKLSIEISQERCRILDNWNIDGIKTVDKGSGIYVTNNGPLLWKGNVVDGVPDGLWEFQVSDEVLGSEIFKNKKFVSGLNRSPLGTTPYDDHSRIIFFPALPRLLISDSNRLTPSRIDCNGIDYSQYASWKAQVFK